MLPFFKYNAGDTTIFSWFNGFGLASLLVGVTCSTNLSRRFGKRNLFLGSMLLTSLFTMALFVLPANATVIVIASEVVRQFSFGISCPVLWAMMGDVADWGEWKMGRRATATVTSAVVFALWAGLALGGWITGLLFDAYGYVPNATQTADSLMGIRLVASVYAGLAFLAVAICLVFYPMTQAKTRVMADELAERRKKFESA